MQTAARRVVWPVAAFLILLIGRAEAQAPDAAAQRQRAIVTALDALAREDWRTAATVPMVWYELTQAVNAELARDPGSQIADLIRQAAVRIDVAVRPVIARRVEDLKLAIEPMKRLELKTPVPYIAEIYAAVDGGEWVLLGLVQHGAICGQGPSWSAGLRPGIHRVHLAVDITYLRRGLRTDDTVEACAFVPPSAAALQQLEPEDIIQRERRILPATSFGIFPDLFGAPAVSARALEAGLPDVPISAWLKDVISSVPNMDTLEDWHADFCYPEEASVFALQDWKTVSDLARRQTRAICLTYSAGKGDAPPLALRLRVATVNEDAAEWTAEPPSFHDLSIGAEGNVLDIPFLSVLPQVLTQPPASFPPLDIAVAESDIRYEPADAKPGDPITVTAVIRNVGGRDAPLTTGMVGLQGDGVPVEWREFVADIPVNGTFEVSFPAKMPRSGEIAALTSPFPRVANVRTAPYSQLRDVNPDNNGAMRAIGSMPFERPPLPR